MNKAWLVPLALPLLLLGACGEDQQAAPPPASAPASAPATASVAPAPRPRVTDLARIARGGNVYQQHCAVCHGARGEGAPDWRKRDAKGKFPPPPLNGSGHTWHHPYNALLHTLREGTGKLGGNMPAWKDKLSDEQFADVIAWFQSQWPDEVYTAWSEIDRRSRER